jgi:NADH:ubiquinone oxidoreductase subunit K
MLLRPPSGRVIIAEAAIGLAIVVVFRKATYVELSKG